MDTDAKGQIGGIECSKDARERMARDSGAWKCSSCGKSNAEVMQARDELVKEIEAKEGKRKEAEVPEELRLAYRDELGKTKNEDEEPKLDKGKAKATEVLISDAVASSPAPPSAPALPATSVATSNARPPASKPTQTSQVPLMQQRPVPEHSIAWIDTCIYSVLAALLFMVLKRFS
jgi:ubiquitin-conjugating enzyme E2 J1